MIEKLHNSESNQAITVVEKRNNKEIGWDILSRGTGARRHWDTRIITDWDSSQKSNSYALGQ